MKGVAEQASSFAKSVNALIVAEPETLAVRKVLSAEGNERLKAIAAGDGTEAQKLALLEAQYAKERETLAAAAGDTIVERVADMSTKLTAFQEARNKLLHDVLYPVGISFEYIFQRPAMQAEYSSMRLAITKPFGATAKDAVSGTDPGSQFTANFGASFYHSAPAGLNALRDFRGGLQLDRKFSWKLAEAKPVFSVAGYGQYQAENGVLEFNANEFTPIGGIPLPKPAKLILDTKGAIFIAQAKLVIPLGDKGVTFPIAVSWANRTELIKATETKWQFGFTFDLDKLLQNSGAK